MTEVAQANPEGLMSIGSVAAHNIAAFLNLPAEHVGTIEQAIKDEISAMSSHFTLAIADVQTQYEAETLKLKQETAKARYEFELAVEKIKSDFVWIEENALKVGLWAAGIAVFAALFGKFVI